MRELVLHLKRKYFDAIRAGTKVVELRRVTAYWCSRLDGDKGRQYTHTHFVLGYAPLDEPYSNIVRAVQKIERTAIVHEEFGTEPVEVFAIHIRGAKY